MAEEIHPRQLIGMQGFGNTVPPAEAMRMNETCSVIAEKLFREDTFQDCHVVQPIVKEELKGLILAVVEFMWDKMCKEITGQFEDAQRSKEKAPPGLKEAYKDGLVELDLNPQEPVDWMEGVEHLKTKTENKLYDMLRFDNRKILFLITKVDTESDFYTSTQTGTYEEGNVFAPAMEPSSWGDEDGGACADVWTNNADG
ncbi:hypothetical protein EDB83DRAFT_2532992 [Lactarius deliciosus]|nr:hypothetical protein EDB83DRAFT_2532992 [Lactarius deliciosus]